LRSDSPFTLVTAATIVSCGIRSHEARDKSILDLYVPETLQVDKAAREAMAETFDELLHQFKIDLVNKAVADCDGNKTLAARKLQVSRAYLHRLIRKSPEPMLGAA
jgi:DNA-binding NtrC family response regulator